MSVEVNVQLANETSDDASAKEAYTPPPLFVALQFVNDVISSNPSLPFGSTDTYIAPPHPAAVHEVNEQL